MKMKTVDIGRIGEDAATKFLKRNGYKILGNNLHASHNELDIIALDKKKKTIIFVEVKARTVGEDLYLRFGTPAAAVDKQKQRRTIDAARSYLLRVKNAEMLQKRFDVIEIYLSKENFEIIKINHIENAFIL